MRLCVLHNLYFYNTMMTEIRDALDVGEFALYKKRKLENMERGEQADRFINFLLDVLADSVYDIHFILKRNCTKRKEDKKNEFIIDRGRCSSGALENIYRQIQNNAVTVRQITLQSDIAEK